MMPLVEIEPDVYDFVRSNVRDFRETESAVLRRLLNLPDPKAPAPTVNPATPAATVSAVAVAATPLAQFVTDMRGKYHRSATDKFLSILGFTYKERPQAFEKVLEIGGRRRRYFGRSQQEIISSGRSTHPKKIPGAPFWVMTNADTRQKCDMLRQTLRVLGYSDDDIRAADNAVF